LQGIAQKTQQPKVSLLPRKKKHGNNNKDNNNNNNTLLLFNPRAQHRPYSPSCSSPRAFSLLFGSRRNPHNKQTNKQTVLRTWEKTNPAVSQKPPERNPKSPDDTGEKKIIIIAVVVVVVAVMVM